MRDIRFISGDGESLILETSDGEKLRLNVDATVRDAIKVAPETAGEKTLTPRDIQDAVRAGATIEELVASSGDSVDFIARFAAPVLEELAHMVASALAVRVEIEPDRFNEVRHREFGELVTERLRNGGASAITWSASRATPFTWLIAADFETMGGVGRATWSFEPRHILLSPENETAVGLSNNSGFGDSPIPKLQVLTPTTSPEAKIVEETEPKVTELLDAFKQRREAVAAETASLEVVEEVETIEVDDELETTLVDDEIPADEPLHDEPAHEPPQDEAPRVEQPRKGRAPMPSWDEIVFGSKTED